MGTRYVFMPLGFGSAPSGKKAKNPPATVERYRRGIFGCYVSERVIEIFAPPESALSIHSNIAFEA